MYFNLSVARLGLVTLLGACSPAVDDVPSLASGNGGSGKAAPGGVGGTQARGVGGATFSAEVTGRLPSVSRAGYFRDPEGATVLVEGLAPKNDVTYLRLNFQDAQGAPLIVSLDGENGSEASFLDVAVSPQNQAYFVRIQTAPGFAEQVPQVELAALNSAAEPGPALAVKLGELPIRELGAPCDSKGFDACVAQAFCVISDSQGSTTCQEGDNFRNSLCLSAPELVVNGDPVVVPRIEGASLWEPPPGCLAVELGSRPEALVRLHLGADLSELSLFTLAEGTPIDSAIALFRGCSADPKQALGCDDDGSGSMQPLLVTPGISAGDYIAVIEAVSGKGPISIRATSR